MGNPQERLIWLAGFIDGEGYLGIKKERRDNRFSGFQLLPRIVISNTNEDALIFTQSILQENRINYSTRFPKKYKETWKDAWKIEVSSMKPVLTLLNLVKPYLVVKQKQAELLIDFARRRIIESRKKYSDSDIKAWQEVKKLNQNPQRLYARVLKEAQDIVRASVKAEEVGRNDQPTLFEV